MDDQARPFDVAIVGAGPAGLHAALKAAILNHRVLLVDKGRQFSRVSQAPALANVPGHSGISGPDLLEQGRRDLATFEGHSGKHLVTRVEETDVVAATRTDEDGFALRLRDADGREREERARTLVLATGVVDRKPGIEEFWRRGHRTVAPYVHRGGVGYCLLCEGWSIEGKRVAVLGSGHDSVEIAVDAERHFRGHVTLLTNGARLDVEDDAERLARAGVGVDERPIEELEDNSSSGSVRIRFAEGEPLEVEKALVTLGWYKANNELAVALGAQTTRDGYVVVNDNMEVQAAEGGVIRGLFAIGDLRAGSWKQVVIGWGDAETAIITAYAYRLPAAADEGR